MELDSLDALELSVGVEYYLDVSVTEADMAALGSVNSLVDFIVNQGIDVPDDFPVNDLDPWDANGDLDDW